jgi:thioredoxin-dependent peroxiredoxin
LKSEFEKENAVIIGISPDSADSHSRFMEKHALEIILLSDPEHAVLEAYGAWQLKKMYGREFMGVVRSTLLIDPDGVIRHTWPKVKVKGHAVQVLDTLKELVK